MIFPTCEYCGGDHLTNEQNVRLKDRECPEYRKQKTIKELMGRNKWSFFEVREAVSPRRQNINIRDFSATNAEQEVPRTNNPSVFTKRSYASVTSAPPPQSKRNYTKSVPAHRNNRSSQQNTDQSNNLHTMKSPRSRQNNYSERKHLLLYMNTRPGTSEQTQQMKLLTPMRKRLLY